MTETQAPLSYTELEPYLTEAEKQELVDLLRQDTRLFFPTPGPQFLAATTKADIIGYGGAAGGGKSWLVTGLALTEHTRSLIFRQHKNQTQKFVQDFQKILGNADGYSSQNSQWKLGDKLVEFAGLEDPSDHQKWQGRDHDLKCVGAGTMVWMADGSQRAIETLRIGDEVQTLEGARHVTRTMSFRKAAIRLVTPLGEQVQSREHQVLTPRGWLAPGEDGLCRSASFSPTSRHAGRTAAGSFLATSSCLASVLADRFRAWAPLPALSPGLEDRRASSVEYEGRARTDRETAIEACCASSRGIGPPALFRLPSAMPRPLPDDRGEAAADRRSLDRDGHGVRLGSSLRGWMEHCSFAPRPGDGRLRLFAEVVLAYLRQLAGAARRSPTCWLVDDPRQTPTHSRHTWSWAHPYTKETRRTAARRRAVSYRIEDVGVQTLFDLTVEGANHYLAGAGFVNRNCYDEATQMREYDVRYTMGWCRSDNPEQRCRTLITFNPPTTAEGRWVIRFFAPWLDKTHPNPAVDGELRWFTTIDGDDDYELPDGRAFVRGPDGEFVYDFDPGEYKGARATLVIRPKSRTFIHARVTDNPYYMATGYVAQLQTLPEPLRSQMLEGDFFAGVEDDAMQVVPTAWVEAAFDRYDELTAKADFRLGPMDSLGVDAARGGNMGAQTGMIGRDKMTIAPRHGIVFPPVVAIPGVDVNTGNLAAAQVVARRRDQAPVHLDVAAIGTSVFDALQENKIHTVALNGTAKSFGVSEQGLLRFVNLRAELYWRMREALDPAGADPVALARDPEVLADLTAARWELKTSGIQIEAKIEIKKRIGRSPDKGEAIIYANVSTPKQNLVMRGFLGHGSASDNYDEQRLKELEG